MFKTREHQIIPIKERKKIQIREIKALYRIGYSMNEISRKMDVSKTTVFFALNGRRRKKVKK